MAASDVRLVEVSGRTVEISNPDRVYFPELGATKFDLVRYYVEIAEPLARTATGRPALLERYPEGAGGKSFFQKRVPAGAPDWLRTTLVSTPNGTTSNALVVADVSHVLWAVNLGCLGLHLWPYPADDPEHADELRIDLDPQPGTRSTRSASPPGTCGPCSTNWASPGTRRRPATGGCTSTSGWNPAGTASRSGPVPWPWPASSNADTRT